MILGCLSSRAMHPCDKDLYEIEYRRSLATPFSRRDRTMRVMNEPIEDSVGVGGVADNLMP